MPGKGANRCNPGLGRPDAGCPGGIGSGTSFRPQGKYHGAVWCILLLQKTFEGRVRFLMQYARMDRRIHQRTTIVSRAILKSREIVLDRSQRMTVIMMMITMKNNDDDDDNDNYDDVDNVDDNEEKEVQIEEEEEEEEEKEEELEETLG
uniref:Uncharacterized protein n=1 Tax=Vespula pensylvanica TaxID=30213 RepID=A0A834NLU9_VESPE|nr:hypothetical protein H0235_012985 [Vespula pensylvanica]